MGYTGWNSPDGKQQCSGSSVESFVSTSLVSSLVFTICTTNVGILAEINGSQNSRKLNVEFLGG